MIRWGWCHISHLKTLIGVDRRKRQHYSIHFGRPAPGIRRDKRINHLDKLNIEGKGMTLRHRRPMIIRRRDDAVHCDQ